MLFYENLLSNDTKFSFLQIFSGSNPISTGLLSQVPLTVNFVAEGHLWAWSEPWTTCCRYLEMCGWKSVIKMNSGPAISEGAVDVM